MASHFPIITPKVSTGWDSNTSRCRLRRSSASVRLEITGRVTSSTKVRFGNQNRSVASRVPSAVMKNVTPVRSRKAAKTP